MFLLRSFESSFPSFRLTATYGKTVQSLHCHLTRKRSGRRDCISQCLWGVRINSIKARIWILFADSSYRAANLYTTRTPFFNLCFFFVFTFAHKRISTTSANLMLLLTILIFFFFFISLFFLPVCHGAFPLKPLLYLIFIGWYLSLP